MVTGPRGEVKEAECVLRAEDMARGVRCDEGVTGIGCHDCVLAD